MIAWRIALLRYGATAREALSGKSGFSTDGRWHNAGRLLDYAAESRSLATLERLVHYERFDSLEPHVIYRLEIPDPEIITLTPLPADWRNKSSAATRAAGDNWHDTSASPALKVPGVVSPGEFNLLLNARHPRWDWNWVGRRQGFRFNNRLLALLERPKSARRK